MSTPGENRCTGRRKNGDPCRAPAFTPGPEGQLQCVQHRASAEQRKAWATLGGIATHRKKLVEKLTAAGEIEKLLDLPDLSTTANVEAFVARVIAEVQAGLLAPSLANAINSLLQTRLKLIELQLTKDLADLKAALVDSR